jgi:hypothetical protein
MGSLEWLMHFLNFLAPAFWVALLLPLAARLFIRKVTVAPVWYAQTAINFAVSCAVLGFGLWYFGHDGKLNTYLGMTLFCATSQWLMLRGGRT